MRLLRKRAEIPCEDEKRYSPHSAVVGDIHVFGEVKSLIV